MSFGNLIRTIVVLCWVVLLHSTAIAQCSPCNPGGATNFGSNTTISSSACYTSVTMANNVLITVPSGVTLTICGDWNGQNGDGITVNNGGTLIITGNLVLTNAFTLTANGTVTISSITVNNSSSLSVGGTGNLTVQNNVSAGNSATLNVSTGGNFDIGGNLSVGTGSTITANGTLDVAGTITGAQPTGSSVQFRSRGTGGWNTTDTWQYSTNGTNWYDATSTTPTSTQGTITVRSGHTVTITSNTTIDQTTIDSGGKLILSGGTLTVANGADAQDLIINGTYERTTSATNMTPTGVVFCGNGGRYIHNVNGGTLPTITWDANSTLQIDQSLSDNEFTEAFGNVIINGSSAFTMRTSGSGITINGNLTFNSSGSMGVSSSASTLTMNVGGSITYSGSGTLSYMANLGSDVIINVTGNYSQSNGNVYLSNYYNDGSMNVTGDFTLSSGSFILNSDQGSSFARINNLNIGGNFNQSGGTLNLSQESSSSASSSVASYVYVAGNFTHTGGVITETANQNAVNTQIVFDGTSGTQTIESTGQTGTIAFNAAGSGAQSVVSANKTFVQSANTSFVIAAGASTPDYVINGTHRRTGTTFTTTGTMSVSSGGTYEHNCNGQAIPTASWNASSNCNVTGITSTALTGGTNQSFGNFTWNCTTQSVAQTLASGFGCQGNYTQTTSNAQTLTTGGNATIGGNMTITAGIFAVGTNFTLGVTGTTSVTGTLTLAGTGAKTFTGNVTINSGGTINETGIAAINFGANFTNDGTYTTTSNTTGVHTVSGTSAVIAGANAISIPYLTFSGGGTKTLNRAVTVSAVLNLNSAGVVSTTTTNILHVTATGAGAVTGTGSSTNMIDGPLRWSLAVGTTYIFPVGDGGNYFPLTLSSVSGSGPIATVQSYSLGSGGSYAGGSVSSSEYWQIDWSGTSVTAGTVKLDRAAAIGSMTLVGTASTANGAYSSLGGSISGTSITATNSVGTVTGSTKYYAMLAVSTIPTITSFTPTNVCASSNSTVTITGTNFTGTTAVTIGGTSAQSFVVNSSTEIIATIGAGTTGTFQVTNASGSGTSSTSVTIDATSVAGTASGGSTICSGATAELNLTGYTGSVQWQQSANGTSGWTNVSSGSGGATASYTTAALISTTYYKAVITNGSCSAASSNNVTVSMPTTLVSGTHNTSALSGCDGINPTSLTVSIPTTGISPFTYQWKLNGSPVTTGTGGTTITYDPDAISTPGTYSLTCTTTDACGTNVTSTAKVITVVADPSAPTATKSPNTASVCATEILTLTSPSYGAEPGTSCGFEYRHSTDGSTWSSWSNTVSSFASVAGTNYIEIRAKGGCSSGCNASTATQYSWTVNSVSSGGTLSGAANVCAGINSTGLTLSGNTGSVTKWQSSTDGSTWSDIAHTSTTYTVTNISATSHYRVVVTNGVCSSANSSSTTINVNSPTPTTSVLNGDYVWRGVSSTDWNTAGNWLVYSASVYSMPASVPGASGTPNVIIPASTANCSISNFPNIGTNTTYSKNLTIESGASLTMGGTNSTNGGIINVSGNWTNEGTFNPGYSTVAFTGTTNASINGTNTFYHAAVNKGSSTANILDVNGTITQTASAADLLFTNGLLRIPTGGSWTKSSGGPTIGANSGLHVNGGSFTLNGASVVSNGIFKLTTGAATIGNAEGNSITSGTGSSIVIDGSGTLNVAGKLVLSGGTYTQSAGNVNVCTVANISSSNANFDISATSNVNITGGSILIKYPNSNATPYSSLRITSGAGSKTISGGTILIGDGSSSSNFLIYSDVALNNLTLNASGNATLESAITANGTVTFMNGKFVLGNSNFTIGSSGLISGESSSTYFVTSGTGVLTQKGINSSSAAGKKLFPIGLSTTSYTPMVLANTGTSDDFSARVTSGVLSGGESGTSLTTKYVDRTWLISEGTGGGSAATVNLYWNAAEEQAQFNRSACFVTHYTGGFWDLSTATSASGNPYTTFRSGITSFSPFSVTSTSALPIELMSFQANCANNNTVDITWSTASEHNTNYFRVDKSRDGLTWDVLNNIGAAGNSNNVIDYALTDAFPNPGINYYRLTQYDNDGVFETFDAQAAVCKDQQAGTALSSYPNPSSADFTVDLQTDELEGEATLLITDAKGAVVYTQDIKIMKGNNNYVMQKFNAEPGMYYITVKAGTSSVTTKHSVR